MRLQVADLCKAYAVPVLDQVNLELREGEVHGLVGENGAGKSTLLKILFGLTDADSGNVMLNGSPYAPSTSRMARQLGISLCSQELSLIDNLSVAENIFLADLPGRWRLQRSRLFQSCQRVLDTLQLDILPDTAVSSLTLAQRQLVEIARVFAAEPQLMLLDEPTSALSQAEASHLHRCLANAAADGTTVVYVSHRLQDVLELCDTVSVLRDGALVCQGDSSAFSTDDLIRHMSGTSTKQHHPPSQTKQDPLPRLTVTNLTTRQLPHPITFQAQQAEILGIAGLMGAGRTELLRAIHGLVPGTSGRIEVHQADGAHHITNVGEAVAAGVGLVPENRATQGIFTGQSLALNITIANFDGITRAGVLNQSAEHATTQHFIQQLQVKCEHPNQPIQALSGGNQQKLMLARWLHANCSVLLLDEPTRGIDVAAKAAIHGLLRELRDAGKTLLVVSSELDELLQLCDRIMVMSNRHLVATHNAVEATEERLLQAAFTYHNDSAA